MTLYTEHMDMLLVDNDSILEQFRKMLSGKYEKNPPSVLLLLGSPAMVLRDDFKGCGATFRLYCVPKPIT